MVATILVSCGFQVPVTDGSMDSVKDAISEREEDELMGIAFAN